MNVRIHSDLDGQWMVEADQADGAPAQPLHEVLKDVRVERGLAIAELERLAGVTHPNYHTFESGKNKSVMTVPDIADALGLELRLVSKGKP